MNKPVALLAVLLLLPLPTLPAAGQRPNIVFIIVDQLLADAMSCRMGTQFLHTPAMDGLAKSGQSFTRAYSANPLCMPSRNSMFTGRYPHETKVTQNASVKLDPAEFVNLGDYFNQAGYRTAYFGKRHLCFNVDKSFQVAGSEPTKGNHDIQTLAAATDFISKKPEQPFLLVVSFINPHNVCELARGENLPDGAIGEAPAQELCPPAPANLAPQQNEPDTMTIMRKAYQASPLFPVGNFTRKNWRELRWGYYRLIEKVDAQIGTLLAALHNAGLDDNTVIVFTSDHGECVGAHGFNQKTVLYEESARVPLIISYPGRTQSGTCDKLVNTGIDLLPTMLDFAGLPVPDKLTGRSLRPLALGETVTAWRDYVVVENDMEQGRSTGDFEAVAQGRMIRTERYKYCVYDHGQHRESLVDLQADPGETRNLAGNPEYHQILFDFRDLLASFAKEYNDSLAASMVADDVKPVRFPPRKSNVNKTKSGKSADDL
jgi:choline-sulfatase